MDALMLLSEHEGLPNALIEAQLAGVPVIATAAGGTPEAVLAGTTGMLTGVHASPAEVADVVAGLATQPDRLRTMGVAAKVWTARAFPIELMLSNTLAAYAASGSGATMGRP
jgi:glycosyltransferase involved in cell wall biosynthesis